MTGRHERLQRLFAEACALPVTERAEFAAKACGDDHELHAELCALLAADQHQDAAFDRAVARGGARMLAEELAEQATIDRDAVLGGARAAAAWLPERVGRYTVLRQLGRGGMGIVYEARQVSPRRTVALKLLDPIHATGDRLKRFRQEAELLGRLQHPGIAQIFEAGSFDAGRGAQPFLAMELVRGTDLRSYSADHELDVPARIELLCLVADAVDYANEHGVVHRDLKPDNVLVDLHGRPRVLDFGIARATDGTTALSTLLTEQGQLVGTLGYMAPEQLSADGERITSRTDVYALGVLGFELLTGRLPRNVADLPLAKAVALLAEADAPPAGRFAPALRGDVETILGKALETDPLRRYPTAAAFAADLRRFLADEPIEARPPSGSYLVRKFARRHKALVFGVIATLAVAVLGALVATGFALEATSRAAELERALYLRGLATAEAAIDQHHYARAAATLAELPEAHRSWEYDHLLSRLQPYAMHFEAPARVAGQPCFSADGALMYAVLEDLTVGTWELATGALVARRPLDRERVLQAVWPYDIVLFGLTREYVALSPGHGLCRGSFAPGAQLPRRLSPTDVHGIVDHDGPDVLLYLQTETRHLKLWQDGRSTDVLAEPTQLGSLHRDGHTVAAAEDTTVRIVDRRSGGVVAQAQFGAPISWLGFSPDGGQLAVTGRTGELYIRDGTTLQPLAEVTGRNTAFYFGCWSPDGRYLVLTTSDGSLCVYPRGRWFSPRIYRARESTEYRGETDLPALLPDGSGVVVAGEVFRVLPFESGVLRGHDGYVYQLALSQDARWLVSSQWSRPGGLLWDVAAGRLRAELRPQQDCGWFWDGSPLVSFSADGERAVIGGAKGTAHWRLSDQQELPVARARDSALHHFYAVRGFPGPDVLTATDRSPDGSLEFLPHGAELLVRDAASQQVLATLRGHEQEVLCTAVRPDGTRIATGGRDDTVRIWDARTFEPLLVLRGHTGYVKELVWSDDGSLLVSASGDGTIRLWDSLPLRERRARAR